MKHVITKILSILCLVAVLVCGFMPFAKITGSYQEMLGNVTGMVNAMTGEQATQLGQALEQFGVKVDLNASVDTLKAVVATIEDGEIAIMDFYEISRGAERLNTLLNGVSTKGLPEEQLMLLEQTGLVGMVNMLEQIGNICEIAVYVALVPVGLFGLLALAIVVRILLRLFNRRGLGVLITLLAILNATFMLAIPFALSFLASNGLEISGEATFVPYVLVGGCLASCIIWGIGRDSKVKVVKEEVVVEVPVAVPVASVEETEVVEEVAVEETVEENAVEEVAVEEYTEEVVTETPEAEEKVEE